MSDLDQFDSYLLTARASSDFLNFGMTTNASCEKVFARKVLCVSATSTSSERALSMCLVN